MPEGIFPKVNGDILYASEVMPTFGGSVISGTNIVVNGWKLLDSQTINQNPINGSIVISGTSIYNLDTYKLFKTILFITGSLNSNDYYLQVNSISGGLPDYQYTWINGSTVYTAIQKDLILLNGSIESSNSLTKEINGEILYTGSNRNSNIIFQTNISHSPVVATRLSNLINCGLNVTSESITHLVLHLSGTGSFTGFVRTEGLIY